VKGLRSEGSPQLARFFCCDFLSTHPAVRCCAAPRRPGRAGPGRLRAPQRRARARGCGCGLWGGLHRPSLWSPPISVKPAHQTGKMTNEHGEAENSTPHLLPLALLQSVPALAGYSNLANKGEEQHLEPRRAVMLLANCTPCTPRATPVESCAGEPHTVPLLRTLMRPLAGISIGRGLDPSSAIVRPLEVCARKTRRR